MHAQQIPHEVAQPTSLAQLSETVRSAEARGQVVVPVGRRRALSKPHTSPGVQLRSDGLDRVLAVVRDERGPGALVRVQAGATVAAVSGVLARHGLALPALPAYGGLSIGGVVATSTHGSGLSATPMPDLVVSADVVVGGGRAVRVEPSTGPTSAGASWVRDVELIQRDDVFHSVVAGLGAAGALYSLTLRAEPEVLLEERRTATSFEALRDSLQDPSFIGAYRDVAVILNPHRVRGRHRAVLTTIRAAEPGSAKRAARRHNRMTTLASRVRVDRWVASLLDRCPGAAPWAIEAALCALSDHCFVGSTADVLGGTPMSEAASAHAIELSVPFERTVPVLEAVLELAREEARRHRWLSVPISVRFGAASKHLLSPQYGRPSTMIEVMTLAGASAGRELGPYAELLTSLGGRLHLGLEVHHLPRAERALANLPGLAAWRRVAAELDPKRTFVHRLVRDLGLR